MAEKPILFSAPMVRALLAGTKTQTRRVVKPVGGDGGFVLMQGDDGSWWPYRSDDGESSFHTVKRKDGIYFDETPQACPYGQPGTKLWVRETWARDDEDGTLMYRADLGRDMNANAWEQGRLEGVPRYRWRPSIHMPRWASRITLEVTGVRVERLQDIGEADALAEGVTPKWEPGCSGRLMEAVGGFGFRPAASAYAELWEQINGQGSWDANPWVWVVEFRRLEAA